MSTNKTTYLGNGIGRGNETLLLKPYLCTVETCDITTMGVFNYQPNLGANAFFAVVFALCLIVQLFFGIKHKTWGYMTAMILGLLLEVVGYAGRIMLNNNPFNNDAFLQYLVTLTIAPALFTAAIYLCLGRIINVYGSHLSYFKPRTYTIVFCTFDLICLILQAAGGAIASTSDVRSTTEIGRKIMIAGILFQVFALTLFILVSSFYGFKVFTNRGSWNSRYASVTHSFLFKTFLGGLVIAVITIQIRSIYRVVELWNGFNSDLFRGHEVTFIILESVMIMIACLCLTALHPAVCFQGAWHDANFQFRSKGGKDQQLKSGSSMDEERGNVMEMRREGENGRGARR